MTDARCPRHSSSRIVSSPIPADRRVVDGLLKEENVHLLDDVEVDGVALEQQWTGIDPRIVTQLGDYPARFGKHSH